MCAATKDDGIYRLVREHQINTFALSIIYYGIRWVHFIGQSDPHLTFQQPYKMV